MIGRLETMQNSVMFDGSDPRHGIVCIEEERTMLWRINFYENEPRGIIFNYCIRSYRKKNYTSVELNMSVRIHFRENLMVPA